MPLVSKPGAPRPKREWQAPRTRRCGGVMTRESIEASFAAGQMSEADYRTLTNFCDELAAKAKP